MEESISNADKIKKNNPRKGTETQPNDIIKISYKIKKNNPRKGTETFQFLTL